MNLFSRNKFLFLFFLIVTLDLYAGSTDSWLLNLIFKPLIVISLLVFLFANNAHKSKAAMLAVGGLAMSVLGDVLLIFQGQNGLFFIGGLVSFLLAHVLYILYYVRSSGVSSGKKIKGSSFFYLVVVVYGCVLFGLLYSHLGNLKLPVALYTLVLLGMNIAAFNRYGKVNDTSFKQILTGALLFTSSDSLLAINKFFIPLPLAGVWIMLTYSFAQYFIVQGVISMTQENQK